MGVALYRKYRSKSLDEIVGQDHITTTLKNALKSGKISHAYLLTGPRGVGKTSVARILAHIVNDLKYDEEANHLDIIEIDAASNRRIDEIRDLREKVHIAPAQARYKVYIIDEVHMLTKEAFNALLKTLEEPPTHAIFILATTEAHKLPETIVSRTQRFSFKPIEETDLVAHLRDIAKKEAITISDEALQLIAEHSSGSFRDSISLLDQASNTGRKVTAQDIQRLLGLAPQSALQTLLDYTLTGSVQQLIAHLQQLYGEGYQAPSLAKQLGELLRSKLLESTLTADPQSATSLLARLLEVPAAHDPAGLLELILLEYNLSRAPAAASPLAATEPSIEPSSNTVTEHKPAPAKTSQPLTVKNPSKPLVNAVEAWPIILSTLKQRHNTLYSIARMAEPSLNNDTLTLKFAFAFHQKRLNDARNKTLFAEVVTQTTGKVWIIECVVDKNAEPVIEGKNTEGRGEKQSTDELKTISNIFGNAEVLK